MVTAVASTSSPSPTLPPSFHPHTLQQQGIVHVGKNHRVYYELHGQPPLDATCTRVLLLCGPSLTPLSPQSKKNAYHEGARP